MRLIQIISTAVVAGAVRYASEGPIPVRDDKEAKRLVEELELAEYADEEEGDADGDGDDLDAMQVADLKKLAADEGVDLGTATKKADIITAIHAHRMTAGQ